MSQSMDVPCSPIPISQVSKLCHVPLQNCWLYQVGNNLLAEDCVLHALFVAFRVLIITDVIISSLFLCNKAVSIMNLKNIAHPKANWFLWFPLTLLIGTFTIAETKGHPLQTICWFSSCSFMAKDYITSTLQEKAFHRNLLQNGSCCQGCDHSTETVVSSTAPKITTEDYN